MTCLCPINDVFVSNAICLLAYSYNSVPKTHKNQPMAMRTGGDDETCAYSVDDNL